jgi:hypothetical protein
MGITCAAVRTASNDASSSIDRGGVEIGFLFSLNLPLFRYDMFGANRK